MTPSEPGKGATFRVVLPAAASQSPAPAPSQEAVRIPGGSETLLVVEDEAGVRQIVERTLRRLGYAVLTAAGPSAALEIASAFEAPIDLLLTDVMMPDVDGATLFRRLHLSRPAMKALFMSGFGDDVMENDRLSPSGAAFLQKPFTAAELAAKVRLLLDGTADRQSEAVT